MLKKFNDKTILKILTFSILVLLPIIKQLAFYFVKYGILTNYDSINPALILFLSVPFLLYLYIKDIVRKRKKLDVYDYLFYIIVFIGILATLFSINKRISLVGKAYRHEGLLTIVSYFLLCLDWRAYGVKKDIKNIIKIITIMGIINSIYAILQVYTPFDFILRYTRDNTMASGICGNPNFFGSYIVTIISIITYLFLINKKIILKYSLLIVLFFISLINCQSTGPFLTYFIFIIFIIIHLFLKKKLIKKNIFILFLILIVTEVFTHYSFDLINNINTHRLIPREISEIKDTMKDGGNGRILIWKNSIPIIEKHPLVGVGYDNFFLAYKPNYLVANTVRFVTNEDGSITAVPNYFEIVDNAHNIYLQILVSTGILGLIPYLIFCLFVFIKGLKSKNEYMFIILSGFIAYSIQAFANINVIQVTPIYYIIMGLILSIKE